ncbi:MAG: lysostaphin resistance A-like protein [Kiloniellaceae bacterium]
MSFLPPPLPPLPPLPVRAGNLLLLVLAFVVGFLAIGLLASRLFPGDAITGLLPTLALFAGQSVFLLAIAWLLVLRPHRLRLADIGLRPTYRAWYRLAVAGGLLCVPVFSLVNLGFQTLFGGPIENPQLQALAPDGFSWTSLVSMLLLVGVVVPFVEEVVFRGLIFGWLRKHLRFAYAAPISAVIFAVVHAIPVLMPPLALMGLLLAAVVERSGSLWPAIILHGVFNSLMTITYYTALAAGG